MHDFGLVVIGAHSGIHIKNLISEYANYKILLVEPVPYNYQILENDYKNNENIFISRNAIFDEAKKDKSIKEGIVYSYKSVNIRILLILTFTLLFWALSQPLIPKIARDVLDSGSTGYAILLSGEALGAIAGSIALPLFPKLFRNSKSIVFCISIYGVAILFFALSKSIIFVYSIGD